jgi:ATP-dependent Lon protease
MWNQDGADSALSAKVMEVFPGLVIDKQRFTASKLEKRGVPQYVAEWVLDTVVPGVGPLSNADLAKVTAWSEKAIPPTRDANVMKHRLQTGQTLKALTHLIVEVQERQGQLRTLAKMKLLEIDTALIGQDILDANKDLLRQGMWGVVELVLRDDGITVMSFRPMQATVDREMFKEARRQFTLDEWRELMLRSMGYNPAAFSLREQSLLLCRLIPLVQKSAHLVELAPKATGKSYLYENISPRVRLISGGNVSPAVLFVNNQSGQWGLLARFSVVALDEVQTLKFEKPEEIIGGLKGFLANGKLTRGGMHETASDCSLVMLANIRLDADQRPVGGDKLVEELPVFLRETAFLDRIRGIVPGWEIRKLGPDCFAQTVGLKADFFGDALVSLRDDLVHDQYVGRHVTLTGERPYKRNFDSVQILAAGLLKILFPHGELTADEFREWCVEPAVRLRQTVWSQLYRLDAEFRQWDETLEARVISE